MAFSAGFILPSPSAALVFLNLFWRLLLGESKRHVFRLLPPFSEFHFLSLTLRTLKQTILLYLEAGAPATSYQPHRSQYLAVSYLPLALHISISRKALLNIWHFSYILEEPYYRSKISAGRYSPVLSSAFVESSSHGDLLHQLHSNFKGSFRLP